MWTETEIKRSPDGCEYSLRFCNEAPGRWYVDLPQYRGRKADLQMVAGADTMLNIIAEGDLEDILALLESEFPNANLLRLTRGYHELHGDYIPEKYQGGAFNHKMWLCPVVSFWEVANGYLY